MPSYYFHLRDGTDVLLDPEGRELPDAAHLAPAALREARSILSEEAMHGILRLDQRIDVHDATGAIVHTLEFVDAVEIKLP